MQLVVNLNDVEDIDAALEFLPNARKVAPPLTKIVGDVVVAGPTGPIPAPVVAPAPPSAPAPVGNANERDAEGYPWDDRIHSGAKTKTDDGKWRRKKGVDDATFNAVRLQLAGGVGMGAATPPPVPVAAPEPVVAAPIPTPPPAPAPVVAAPPPPPTFPPVGWVPHPDTAGYYYCGQEVLTEQQLRDRVAAPQAVNVDWPAVCALMNEKITAGKIDGPGLNKFAKDTFGYDVIAMVAPQSQHHAQVYNFLSSL